MKIQRVPYKSIPSTFAEDLDKTKYEDPAVYNMVYKELSRTHVEER